MDSCSQCGVTYRTVVTQEIDSYSGGTLTVTDVPLFECNCESSLLVADSELIGRFVSFLESHQMVGDVNVSLSKIKSKNNLNEISILKEKDVNNHKLDIKLAWMKEQLGIDGTYSTEILFSKALSFVHWAIELEQRGYKIEAVKKLGFFEGIEHLVFRILPSTE
jgi:hypothetical protein